MAYQYINKLKVQNFGPVRAGFSDNEGYMEIPQVTIFCGTQGTGKSTIAKLYSTFVWLEKALMRGDVSEAYVTQYSRFSKKYLAFQGIQNYSKEDSYMHYMGMCYDFEYKEGKLAIYNHIDRLGYNRPQVMYVPAERNLLGVLDKAANVKGMPESLAEMLGEYRQACQSLKSDLMLPVNGVSFHYDSLNQMGSIVSPDYKVRISEASSGLQSLSPMYVTLSHLHDVVVNGKNGDLTKTTKEEQELIEKRVHDILLDDTLSDEMRSALVKKLYDNGNKCLVSIIEEPEQNLFPDSQEKLLYSLLRLSGSRANQLMLTTHSPYIIDYLCLAIKSHDVADKVNEEGMEKLCSIVPREAWIDGRSVAVYQMNLDGTIKLLPQYENMPSDNNVLNMSLADVNVKFSNLVEMEMIYGKA